MERKEKERLVPFLEFDRMIANSRLSNKQKYLSHDFSCFCSVALFGETKEDKKIALNNLKNFGEKLRKIVLEEKNE